MIEDGRCYVVAEIGINHNGDLEIAKQLISKAKETGFDAVKFQKRTVEVIYTPDELARPLETPFGDTNGDYRYGREFGNEQYDEIDRYCRELGIEWFASPWDEGSVDFLVQYDPPYLKIASACVTDRDLLIHCAATEKPLLVSTGMCDLPMIHKAVDTIRTAGGKIACLYHCTSTYPAMTSELNLYGIRTLQNEFPDIPIGYSGHEPGVPTTIMAAVLGAASIERHITLGRTMWGTDHASSLEIPGMMRLVRDLRAWEVARGDGIIRVYDSEKPIAQKLRRKNTL